MKTLLIATLGACALAGCASSAVGLRAGVRNGPVETSVKATVDAAGNSNDAHIPKVLEPNHGMSGSRAAGLGAASKFMR